MNECSIQTLTCGAKDETIECQLLHPIQAVIVVEDKIGDNKL